MNRCGFVLLFFSAIAVLTVACATATSEYLKRGEELEKAQLYQEALEQYQQAKRVSPEDPEIDSRILRLKRKLAGEQLATARMLLEQNQPLEAAEALKQALEIDPSHDRARRLLSKTILSLLASIDRQARKGAVLEAYGRAQKLRSLFPEDRQVERTIGGLRKQIAGSLLDESRQHLDRGLFGNAFVLATRANELGAVGAEGPAEQALQKLARQASFGVKVAPAGRKKKSARRFAGKIAGSLSGECANCPTLSFSGPYRLKISIEPTAAGCTSTKQKTTAEKKYQSGTRKVDNPEYAKIEQQISDAELAAEQLLRSLEEDDREIEQRRMAFAEAGPEDDENSLRKKLIDAEQKKARHRKELDETRQRLKELRQKLRATPRKLDEPVYDVFTYPVSIVTRTCRMGAKVVVYGENGRKLAEENLAGEASCSDKTNRAWRRYGVRADPLQMEFSDAELLAQARKKLAGEIDKLIETFCRRWQRQILDRARAAAKDSPIEATEDFVLYLMVSRGKVPEDVTEFLTRKFQIENLDEAIKRLRTGKPEGSQPAGLEI